MLCPKCGKGTLSDSTTTYYYKLPNCYVIIENVPCERCDMCDEDIIDIKVMKKLEHIIKLASQIADKVFIADFSRAA